MLRQGHVQLANDQIFDHGVEVRLGWEVLPAGPIRPEQRLELLSWGLRSEIRGRRFFVTLNGTLGVYFFNCYRLSRCLVYCALNQENIVKGVWRTIFVYKVWKQSRTWRFYNARWKKI